MYLTDPVFCFAQSNISGKAGLIYTPVARMSTDGTMAVGFHYFPSNYGFNSDNSNPGRVLSMNLTVLPRFDININVLQLFSTAQHPVKLGLGDRQLDFRYLLLKEKKNWPALAVIISTPTSISPTLLTHALFATKNFPVGPRINMELTAGYGSPFHVYRKGSTLENYGLFANMVFEKKSDYRFHKHYLEGPFGGLSLQWAGKYGLMLEYDSQNINAGLYAKVYSRWTLQASVINAQQISFGGTYELSLMPPKKNIYTPYKTHRFSFKKDTAAVVSRQRKTVLNDLENVRIDTSLATIFYEQRLYRNPLRILERIKQQVPAVDTLIPLFQGIPVGKYVFTQQHLSFQALSDAERRHYKSRFPLQSAYKFDFWIQPYFAAIFGNFDKPIQSNTSIALQSQLVLWPGMSFNFGILFPLINDLDNRPKRVRPSPVFVNQFYAAKNNFFSVTAGFFQNDQYGLNVQYQHANLKSPWSYGLEAGYTGDYYYPHKGIYYQKLENLLLIADLAYRLKGPNLVFKVSAGKYLAADKGARIDVIRQFFNAEIGFYAASTTNGSTVGFNFAIPLFPGKILQGKHVRLRTTDEFRWEYSYTRGYRIGERYRLGYQLDQKLRQFHVNYLNSQSQGR